MSTKFFTNEGERTLLNKFEGVFTSNPDLERFDALVGYLRASGYFALRRHFESVPKIRILVGINVDEIMAAYHRRGQLFLADSGAAVEKFQTALKDDLQQAEYSKEVENGIIQFTEDVISGKIEIKAHPTKNLHAKIYIFIPEGYNEHRPGAVITGSSNLTGAGLGTQDQASNYEFNVLLHGFDDVEFASSEFERLWSEGVAILPQDVNGIREKSFLREDITPYQLYIKLLMEYFGPAVEYDPSSEADLPDGFLRLVYQMDAVSQGFQLLQKHRGFFLSDVVGLGKSIIGALIAKKFFYHNGFPEHISSTLIIVPPAMKKDWSIYVDKFDLKEVRIVTSGSLHKIRNPEKYDLVIVDEAHKFRSDRSQGYEMLQKICKTPTKRRLADGSFAEKRVILISATPLNNKPDDIRNLLLLFQDGKDSTLEVANLQRFFYRKQKDYEEALKEPDKRVAQARVAKIYEEIRSKVVQEITIRRTRTDLKETEDYANDLDKQGVTFPDVAAPNKIFYELDEATETLYDETVQALSRSLTYSRYKAISNLKPEVRGEYRAPEMLSNQLAQIMKTMLLKRLDSSFHAFALSLSRFRDATSAMVQMFQQGRIFIAPEENVTEYILDDRAEELLERLTNLSLTDPSIRICTPEDFEPGFIDALIGDLDNLDGLCHKWSLVDADPKLDKFLEYLNSQLLDVSINPNEKLVVFSEAKDTTRYLERKLRDAGFKRLIAVDSSNRNNRLMDDLKANFDANAPEENRKDEFDIVISTEVLAEGVNLHRSNVIVNYDTPWNSTRLMQRIGRVNRIGSTAPRIHIYNFFPTARVNEQIALEQRALLKLQAFHSALGEDSQIYSPDEEYDTFGLFEKAPEEERDETLEFLDELRRFSKTKPEEYKKIRNLPLKARVGRKDRHRHGSTVSYVRNARRNAFFLIRDESEIEELGFVETARIFRASARERSRTLPDNHHAHVCKAVELFRAQLSSEAVVGRTAVQQLGPNERKVLDLLAALGSLDLPSQEEKELLKAGADAIRAARFDPLRRRLLTVARGQRRTPLPPAQLLDRTLEVLKEFPLDGDESIREQRFAGLSFQQLLPDIILSESFID